MNIPKYPNSKPIQLKFEFDNHFLTWPPNKSFPLNIPNKKRTVLQEVNEDIEASDEYLVVTGFTSLAHIIDSFGSGDIISDLSLIRIVLGWEPNVRRRKNWGKADLQKEIKDYWLERGYSIFKGGNVIKTIGLIKAGRIQFKIFDHLHAKIYVGNSHAILGSANFSKNGLTRQQEANIRVANSLENSFEKQQYQSIFQIANNFYEQGKDYTDGIIDLLKQLLGVTTWEEALARAIAELIDGNWFGELPELYEKLKNINLWPSQRAALAQAFYVLQNQGCVLIADPAGSGKTKLISALYLLLFHWLWETGRKNNSYALVVCPPIVQDIWDQEFLDIQFIHTAPISMGLLSNSRGMKYHSALKKIQAANILIIDEAHNYLNFSSRRSENLSKHTSDYVILTTATPISKRTRDLLRLIELLDIDNLADKELTQFKRLKRSKLLQRASELDDLREYIQKFMVRRTKKQLKELIQREPEQYRDKFGNLCQYPKTISSTYGTGETKNDRNIASEINKLAWQLKGVLYLQRLDLPEFYSVDEAKYIEIRLKAARALSVFMIQAKLRSSRAAIVELVEGTKAASEFFGFKASKNPTGNFLKKIKLYQKNPPKFNLSQKLLPGWLTDERQYKQICDEELKIYNRISHLAKQLSESREIAKIEKIVELFESHDLIIAFDSTIITLDYFKKIISERYPHIETLVVTGSTQKSTVLQKFELGSQARNLLGLFSDSMSEGVNLQQASALFFLDMPSVLRLAEQRIGRIDRLDSPHNEIRVFWPDDSNEFALKTDRRLVKTLSDAEVLIGSNFQIPDEILDKHPSELLFDQVIKPKDMLEDLDRDDRDDSIWNDLQDAFGSVHDLYQAEDGLITREDYEQLKGVNATVKCKISILESQKTWLFIAIRGSKKSSPRWYFIDSNNKISFELTDVCQQLRHYLNNSPKQAEEWTDKTSILLEQYFDVLRKNEIRLLPNKRRRALEVAKYILERLLGQNLSYAYSDLYQELLRLFEPASFDSEYSIDFYDFSQQWLDLFSPYIAQKRQKNKRRIISLNDLKRGQEFKEFTETEMHFEKLKRLLKNVPYKQSHWRNIAACIIGVPSESKGQNA